MSVGAATGCPSDETLVRFVTGHAAQGERALVARHLDGCTACALVLAPPETGSATSRTDRKARPFLGASLSVGDVLAERYRVVRPLGAGGMGEVYEAFDLSLNEAIALKTVRATIADTPRSVELLKSEVQLARRVTHENVCRIFDFGVASGHGAAGGSVPFLTMELLRGSTLARLLTGRPPLPDTHILTIARQVAAGLLAAHKVGVIHKDLKSENVIVTTTPEGLLRALVTDFGLAATRGLMAPDAVLMNHFSGTPGYIAPERRAGAPATEASDVFALGVVLDDLATCTLPPRRVRAQRGAISDSLRPVLEIAQRCQAEEPSARPGLSEIVEALASREPRRHPAWAIGGGTAVATAVLFMALVSVRERGVPPRPPPAPGPTQTASLAPVTRPPELIPSTPEPTIVPAPAPSHLRSTSAHRKRVRTALPLTTAANPAPSPITSDDLIRTLRDPLIADRDDALIRPAIHER